MVFYSSQGFTGKVSDIIATITSSFMIKSIPASLLIRPIRISTRLFPFSEPLTPKSSVLKSRANIRGWHGVDYGFLVGCLNYGTFGGVSDTLGSALGRGPQKWTTHVKEGHHTMTACGQG